MVTLRRTVRFCVNPGGGGTEAAASQGTNGFAGRPAMRGLGRYYELVVTCVGRPDPATGYLVNIKTIDDAARRSVIPRIAEACERTPWVEPLALLPRLGLALSAALAPVRVAAVLWRLTPTYSVEVQMNEAGQHTVLLRQRFDFAAAHRLHVADLSDAENRAVFGKCNNPNGHGHNYMVEPCVAVDPGAGFGLAELEAATEATIIDAFDHRHLNEDTRAFSADAGVNPSVENMARVFFDLLAPEVARGGAALVSLTVWETDRTSATVSAV